LPAIFARPQLASASHLLPAIAALFIEAHQRLFSMSAAFQTTSKQAVVEILRHSWALAWMLNMGAGIHLRVQA
jgi:hypothetical protein